MVGLAIGFGLPSLALGYSRAVALLDVMLTKPYSTQPRHPLPFGFRYDSGRSILPQSPETALGPEEVLGLVYSLS